ncbi:glycogen debranching enzyme [Bdellovibrio bacteriovorus]|uniref:Glycogen debranching enzyme n=1 Tax=Bdellovibrio bacteriovorus TaxID=959 RepID=A0A150WJA4_BDEBC|nr:glycogen debranching protein GlgX [Bdellovibrio bacteriovorus]KYG63796.1 glycogen debranching enzyme [Bdellovibrio bacteriovorus]
MSRECWRGSPNPLGATVNKDGVNFALYSENAEKVFLCLYDDQDQETDRIELKEQTYKVWHGFIPGIKPGQAYGYRVEGPFDPEKGHYFNSHKLLLDPYAKALSKEIQWDNSLFHYNFGGDDAHRSFNEQDSGKSAAKSLVIDDSFNWSSDRHPQVPWNKTIIYETHVKGVSQLRKDIPENLRGTYAGLAHPNMIEHFKTLGVTTIELLPVHQFIEDQTLQEKSLSNYWGYNTISYFSPALKYSSTQNPGDQVQEFKAMVKTLHAAGLEVILDVVYNHTAEGNHLGPMLSFKGIDNAAYYRLNPESPEHYMDYTGCGNTLNVQNPHVLRLITDSLRYWVTEMHVDGFRFDLASALAREMFDVNQLHSFFAILQQDPVLSQVKLIAEPWDLGEGGYQVGNFPDYWSEWNDKYRDTVRGFWKGEEGRLADLGYRLMGSSDLYESSGRGPCASINFITAHDGFTLHDLVSYDHKHNEANNEDNRDGNDNNHSANWGHEGETQNTDINNLRTRIKKNLLATLFLSQGVPMLTAGDELGRTQKGNNNAYCQDNELSWIHWDAADPDLLNFTRNLIAVRNEHPAFHRRHYFEGESLRPGGKKDVFWFLPNGDEMTEEQWTQNYAKCLALSISGTNIQEFDEKGQLVKDKDFIWLLNGSDHNIPFSFPKSLQSAQWKLIIDTNQKNSFPLKEMDLRNPLNLTPHSLMLIQKTN